MNDGLPTDLMVNAQIRVAYKEGVTIVVSKRGDNSSGTIILKINKLDGTARVLTQVRYNDELVWCPISKTDPMPESDADRYLEQQAKFDTDCWIIEIEDKQGRIWFPGRVIKA
ncbi:MAG: DUF1491 family protein [Alphaproteobacteria bacterium]|nr:DUF1491 family protein [Alphaproteobacteria bacterium]